MSSPRFLFFIRKQQKLLHDREGGDVPRAIFSFDRSQCASQFGVDFDDFWGLIPNDSLGNPSSDAKENIALLIRRGPFFVFGW